MTRNIIDFKTLVEENRKIIDFVNDRVAGDLQVDKYYGTLDYATARFNTILLKLSQNKTLEEDYQADILDCHTAIQDFYKIAQRYRFWPKITRPFISMILHGIGTRRIPKIKNLLNKVVNNTNDRET